MALSRLKKKYVEEIVPDLMERLQYKSVMQVPKIKKISINQGLGAAVNDKKLVQAGVDELTLITGQKAVATKAKKSISNFKLREDMPIGAKVTLRGDMMYEFLDRLISVAIPRVRDFRGLNNKGFDGNGNYKISLDWKIFSNQKINNVDQTTKQVEKNKNYKTENIEKTINRVLKKIEKKELKLSELTTSLEKHEFKNTRNSDEYNTLIQNIKETQEDLFFLEKEWRELEEKSMDIEGSK